MNGFPPRNRFICYRYDNEAGNPVRDVDGPASPCAIHPRVSGLSNAIAARGPRIRETQLVARGLSETARILYVSD